MLKTDVCILGAGPGGATAALHLANKGISSLLVDKAVFPRDKVCGDALSGKVVNELRRISPDLPQLFSQEQEALPSWGIHFISPGGEKLSVPFKYNYQKAQDAPAGYISKRLHFDNFLIEQVKQRSEVRLLEGVEVAAFERLPEGGFALLGKDSQSLIQTKLLLVANGAQSAFSRHVANLQQEPEHYCAGLRAYYKGVEGLDGDNFIELHFFKDFLPGYFWIFPLPNGHANVGVGMLSSAVSKKKVNLKKEMLRMIESHPALQQRFRNAELLGGIKGYGLPLGSKKRRISGDNYMLLGDAGALIDPFTGEGVSNAMISGRWAAEQVFQCLQAQDFSTAFMQGYDKAVYNRLWKELKLSRQMQRLLNYPWLFDKVASKASKNTVLAETISCMFNDLDLRERLKQPSFYLKLLFN
ncbi:geranylgeranyl reductase family protein [Pontibacter ummariensis]|uniref:Geranylgeranyl reductase family n=1 Tax=Pontibacter ummariensis TaxID=1610492 RepID=A0A239JMX9_9BACT|nr:geranylgeranyl reductase family protein [Pontibacter ummariensis]PRY07888.1 geranylgeranyl reductase family protein [Pontibacter ummariensis]SNT06912.1 geranylgeranyl reductase family [Pontibacter ummariensis]